MAISANTQNLKLYPPQKPPLCSINEFKEKFVSPILSSYYMVTFSGPYFDAINGKSGLECKVTSVSMPNYQVDNETVYLGGTTTSIPSGQQKGNLEVTIINQGSEFNIIYGWMKKIFDPYTRTYAYYDSIKTKLIVTQYKTNGTWVLEHHYFDCTPYNMQIGSLSYDTTDLSKFSLSLNYFAYECIYNEDMSNNLNVKTNLTGTKTSISNVERYPGYRGSDFIIVDGLRVAPGTRLENGVYVGPNTGNRASNYDGTN